MKFIFVPFGSCSQPKTRLSVPASSKTTYAPSLQSIILYTDLNNCQVERAVVYGLGRFFARKPCSDAKILQFRSGLHISGHIKSFWRKNSARAIYCIVSRKPPTNSIHTYSTVMHGSPRILTSSNSGMPAYPRREMTFSSVTSTHSPSISMNERPGADFTS